MRKLVITGSKSCNRCRVNKPLDQFPRNRSCSDGRYSLCKDCRRSANKAWLLAHKDEQYKLSAERYQKNKSHLSDLRKARYRANKDRELARNKAWLARQPSEVKAYYAAWAKRDPLRSRALVARRRARKKQAEGHYTKSDIEALLLYQCSRCNCCGCVLERYDVDHIIPLSRGGSNWPNNLQILCRTCNRKKSYKTPEEWRIVQSKQQSAV